MRSTLAKSVALFSILILGTMILFTQDQDHDQRRFAIPIGTGYVVLDSSVIDQYGNVQAFIETGSTSHMCLVTHNESNFAGNETPAFCIQRDFQGKHGVVITFGFPFGNPVPSDFVLSLTVYQFGAHGYGNPILYNP